jgi:hypothetical protein
MARLARTVVAGLPHNVTQRGNRRETVFLGGGDQEVYRVFRGPVPETPRAELIPRLYAYSHNLINNWGDVWSRPADPFTAAISADDII